MRPKRGARRELRDDGYVLEIFAQSSIDEEQADLDNQLKITIINEDNDFVIPEAPKLKPPSGKVTD